MSDIIHRDAEAFFAEACFGGAAHAPRGVEASFDVKSGSKLPHSKRHHYPGAVQKLGKAAQPEIK
jgi:hypothetical protein